jgi:hypothetical protein
MSTAPEDRRAPDDAPNGEGELGECPLGDPSPDPLHAMPSGLPVALSEEGQAWLYTFSVCVSVRTEDWTIRIWTELRQREHQVVMTEQRFNEMRDHLFRTGLDLVEITRVPHPPEIVP